MRLKSGYNPLIIVGSWNKAIFSPEWITKYLFPSTQVQIEYPINNSNASIRFRANNIALNIIDQRLLFYTEAHTDEVFDLIGETAISLCRFLPHTPVTSFGINHIFESSKEEVLEQHLFDISDNRMIEDHGYTIQSIKTIRTIQLEDCILNLSYTQEGETVVYDFNYHYNISSIEEFIQKFSSCNISQKKNHAIEVLSMYDLHLE